MVAGVLVFAFGGIQFLSNQPKKFDRSESEQTILGIINLGNFLEVQAENFLRKERRENSKTTMILGGIIVLVGGILNASVKSESTITPLLTSDPQTSNQIDYQYCSFCGAKIRKGSHCISCNSDQHIIN